MSNGHEQQHSKHGTKSDVHEQNSTMCTNRERKRTCQRNRNERARMKVLHRRILRTNPALYKAIAACTISTSDYASFTMMRSRSVLLIISFLSLLAPPAKVNPDRRRIRQLKTAHNRIRLEEEAGKQRKQTTELQASSSLTQRPIWATWLPPRRPAAGKPPTRHETHMRTARPKPTRPDRRRCFDLYRQVEFIL